MDYLLGGIYWIPDGGWGGRGATVELVFTPFSPGQDYIHPQLFRSICRRNSLKATFGIRLGIQTDAAVRIRSILSCYSSSLLLLKSKPFRHIRKQEPRTILHLQLGKSLPRRCSLTTFETHIIWRELWRGSRICIQKTCNHIQFYCLVCYIISSYLAPKRVDSNAGGTTACVSTRAFGVVTV